MEVELETHPNTGLTLMYRNGTPIQENDDAPGLNGSSRIIWRTLPIETEYVLMVNSMDPAGGTGSYILYIEPIPDQYGNSMALATEIIPGNNYFGIVSPSDDLDFFRFFAQTGETYVIEAALDGHPDTVLILYQARGLQVDANDDGEGMDGGSRLNWTAPSTGDYFIEVKSFDQLSHTGGYVLSFERGAGSSISGFYTGSIASFEGDDTAVLQLELGESQGEVVGYLTLLEPHVASGELEFGSYSEGVLSFSIFESFQGGSFVCDYDGNISPEDGEILGGY